MTTETGRDAPPLRVKASDFPSLQAAMDYVAEHGGGIVEAKPPYSFSTRGQHAGVTIVEDPDTGGISVNDLEDWRMGRWSE